MSATVVVARGWVVDPAGGGRALPDPWGLADVVAAADAAGACTVLVLDVAGWSGAVDGLELTGSLGAEWRFTRPAVLDDTAPARRVDVVMVEADTAGGKYAGPWAGLEPRDACAVLRALEGVLGVPWASSVGQTAERLILSTHPRAKGGRRLDVAPVTPVPVAEGNLELDLMAWRRPLEPRERRLIDGGGWVHVFDANAQHLAAWQAAELGHGTPVHEVGPVFDRRRVGFWRVEGGLDGLPTPAAPLLPAPWLPGREWYSTPTMLRALEVSVGMDFPSVTEAWLWPESSRFLREAGVKLRDARARASARVAAARVRLLAAAIDDRDVDAATGEVAVAGAVLEAVKAVYSRQAGRFQMARGEDSGWARPDWGHIIRATARANLHRRMEKLSWSPLAVATDALVFVSDERDPRIAAERLRLPLGVGLGEFRAEGTAPAAELVDELEGAAVGVLMRAIGAADRG
jgi:hypothetical protein